MTPAGLALIGVPANSSGTVDGVARGPAVVRQRGLATALARYPGFTDAGDLALPVPSRCAARPACWPRMPWWR
jgi:hypothetical protein